MLVIQQKSIQHKSNKQKPNQATQFSQAFQLKPILQHLLLGSVLAFNPMLIQAEETNNVVVAVQNPQALPQISVTATRNETSVDNVPATITVKTREEIERNLAADEADLFKYEPDVSFARDLRRFGSTRINIRGIEDNRVAQMVDSVRLPDYYNSGGPTNFTMGTPLGVSTDFLKRVEILRGPASTLYGSDAIGGVVGYVTLDAADVIAEGKDYGVRYRFGYTGENDGVTNSLLGAWRSDRLDVLLGYSRTDSNQFDNKGHDSSTSSRRTSPNSQDVDDQGVMAKFVLRPAEGHQLSLMLEGREQNADVDVKRLSTSLPSVTSMTGDDSSQRWRTSMEWEHQPENRFYDRLVLRLYRQESEAQNDNSQTRTNTSATCSAVTTTGVNTCLVDQRFKISHESTGGGLQMESGTKLGQYNHLFTYGVDLSRVETEEWRDATRYNLTTGTVSKSIAGDTFPVRDFPTGITDTVGVFVQDEISGLANDKLALTPGVRYDWRKLEPDVDALAQTALTANGRSATEQKDARFSPKLGAMWQLNPVWSLYGQVASGFRAPNYNEVNGTFRNTIQQYAISPNADLKPETSVGVEIGTKWHAATLRGQFAVYDNHYKDFIENVQLSCPTDSRCISGVATTFMNVNVSSVQIYGAEMRGAWDFTPGWSVNGALAYAHGTNESRNQPLNTVEPMRMSLGLTRDAGWWGAEARVRAATSVSRTDDTDGNWSRPDGYSVTNLSAWWKPTKATQLNVAVNNLFDKKYFLWSDIRQADSRSPLGMDFYSQPERNLSASFSYQF